MIDDRNHLERLVDNLAHARDVAARASTIERVAEAIYRNHGISDEGHLVIFGHPRRAWKTDAPWDSQPDVELCEHERDDYRAMAKAAIAALIGEITGTEPVRARRRTPGGIARGADERFPSDVGALMGPDPTMPAEEPYRAEESDAGRAALEKEIL